MWLKYLRFPIETACFKSDSKVFQQCFKSISRVFHEYFRSVSRVFQECFRTVSRAFQVCYMVYDIKSEPGHNITGHPQFQGNSDPLNRHQRSDFYNLIREDKITKTWAFDWNSPNPSPHPNLGPVIRSNHCFEAISRNSRAHLSLKGT